ncbi:MAG: ribosome biogenesis GTPase Der [Bacteroidota bacterium]
MRRAIVAIVGRTNVGKSTLFNRIVGQREAIVDATPGVTRDRHTAEADWAGKSFTLVDTGGYIPRAESQIEAAVREHAKIAIEEADSVVLLVDAVSGITPTDDDIARILRRSNKRVVLAVNKVDSDRLELEVGRFYELGLGAPLPISALLGRGIGDFLDILTSDIKTNDVEEPVDLPLKIAIVGKPNVGKSSLVNALLGHERAIVLQIPGTTRDSIDSELKYHGEAFVLIDTAGLRRKSRIKESVEFYSTMRVFRSLERCDVAVVVMDVTTGLEKQDLRIIQQVVERNRGIVLAINKWDLIEKETRTAERFEKEFQRALRVFDFIPLVFISAKTKQRVHKLIEFAKKIQKELVKRVETNDLNRALLEEIRKRPPASASGKEVRIKYVTQIQRKMPVFAFFVNEPQLVKEQYRRFLENKIRQHFGFEGVPLTIVMRRK